MFLENLFFKLRSEHHLYTRYIEEDYVVLPLANLRLYGFELISKSDTIDFIDPLFLKKCLITKETFGSKQIIFTIQKLHVKDDLYFVKAYLWTYSTTIADLVKTEYNHRFKQLKGLEIANILYSLLLITPPINYDEIEGKVFITQNYFTTKEQAFLNFRKLTLEIDTQNSEIYIGCNFIGTNKTLFKRVLHLPWTGVLYFCLNLEDQLPFVKEKLAQSLKHREGLINLKETLEKKLADIGSVSCYFYTKDKNPEYLITLFQSFGFTPLQKHFGKTYLLKATPFIIRDYDYYFHLPIEELIYYVPISIGKTTCPTQVILHGKNAFNNFVAFNNFEECDNPHIMLFAPSGAGKSFFLQNFVTQVFRINLKEVYEKFKTSNLSPNLFLRYFDKGFSAELFMKFLQERGYDITIMSPRINEIAYNICDIDTEEDIEFSTQLVSAFLTALGQEPLKGLEINFYIFALREIYNKPDELIMMRKKQIQDLQFIEELKPWYQKLSTKYGDKYYIGNITDPECAFLKKATIADVIRVLTQSKKLTLSQKEKEALDSVILKLELLSQYPLISNPATFDFRYAKIFYFDYEFLSTHSFFVPLFIALLKRLIFIDKFYKKENQLAIYIIDEAHNLFRKPIFAELLSILIREARKYKISLCFSTQNFTDIPKDIILNADTKMFLVPQELANKKAYLQQLSQHLQINLENEILSEIYYNMPARQLVTWYKEGVFALYVPVDEYKLKIFDSYRKQLQLPEGKTLYKSTILQK